MGVRYSPAGLKLLSPRLKTLNDLPWSAAEQRREASARATKMSIQGVQPKLSAKLDVPGGRFEIVDTGGEYILKPRTDFPEVPENEALTMRLAGSVGIEIPLHGLVHSADGSRTYFIRRFDRAGKGRKIPVEDFSQLSGQPREAKYDSSMERVAEIVGQFCTFPMVEKVKLFRLTLFNYLTGNEDAHLKNYSVITRDGVTGLSPAYDLLNTTIVLDRPGEEIALPIDGRKKKLSRSLLVKYFGKERLGLSAGAIEGVLTNFSDGLEVWDEYLTQSFLSETMKKKYAALVLARRGALEV